MHLIKDILWEIAFDRCPLISTNPDTLTENTTCRVASAMKATTNGLKAQRASITTALSVAGK